VGNQILAGEVPKKDDIHFLGQQQVVKVVFNLPFRSEAYISHERDVDIGAGLVIAFGTGAEQDGPLDAGVCGKNMPDTGNGVIA
jgi:hypothetical protein